MGAQQQCLVTQIVTVAWILFFCSNCKLFSHVCGTFFRFYIASYRIYTRVDSTWESCKHTLDTSNCIALPIKPIQWIDVARRVFHFSFFVFFHIWWRRWWWRWYLCCLILILSLIHTFAVLTMKFFQMENFSWIRCFAMRSMLRFLISFHIQEKWVKCILCYTFY